MSAENARPATGTGAFESAGGPKYQGNRIGCPAGCGDVHECHHDQPLSIDRSPCTGRCWSLGVDELRHYGDRYQACPCTVSASRRSA